MKLKRSPSKKEVSYIYKKLKNEFECSNLQGLVLEKIKIRDTYTSRYNTQNKFSLNSLCFHIHFINDIKKYLDGKKNSYSSVILESILRNKSLNDTIIRRVLKYKKDKIKNNERRS